jgi:hypothetical protein
VNTVLVTDLVSARPLSGVTVEAYDFQQQPVGSGSTDNNGIVQLTSSSVPFIVTASLGTQRGYLRTIDGEALSMSNFDVGGERVNRGIKGFLYGERGVWRPGDSLYLTFLLEDKMKLMPEGHPVVLELQNPQGQITKRIVRSVSENGFYKFATRTEPDDPTGNWNARVKVGGTEFAQPLKIETVKPNRLKISLDFGVDRLTAGGPSVSGDLQVNWLHGAPGKNLKAEFEATLVPVTTRFPKFEEFTFDDDNRYYNSETITVFEGYTDESGHAEVNALLELGDNPPGALTAIFRGKVYEESGNFSIDRFTLPYFPYESFVGLRLPKGDRSRGMLLTDTTHRVDLVTVDGNGNPVSRNLSVTIDKIRWRYWWETSNDPNFLSHSGVTRITSGTASTGSDGRGSWNFRIKYPDWGLYYVKVCDPASGHCAGRRVYIDWPGWAGRARKEGQASTMLSFAASKESYNVGEQAEVIIPGSEGGRALISIENGSKVLQTEWLETKAGDNPYRFEVTSAMTPNVFVSVSLIQPHAQSVNDQPLRLYGVIPLMVEDPATHLTPEIAMPDVLEPGQEVTIRVSEKANRRMTYTVAVVDEGLLDLTRFKTPDAWSRFYAREALGVRTWDLFDDVIGAFGGKLDRILAIGGDAELRSKEDDSKSNRFKPVVLFFGPYTLDGRTNEHTFTMPNYIGSVKTMLVAGYEGAYGLAEKVTPVRKPLMVLATLPRVLGPEEKLKLPITLFSMEKGIRDVKVDIKVSGPLELPSGQSLTVNMQGKTDATSAVDLSVKSEMGWAKVEVTATASGYSAKDVINIEVRNPNPPVTEVTEILLEPGKTWSGNITPVGMAGTNSATLEVSTLPPLNLGQRLKYLLGYPYGCIEQTTSAVFPQLYLAQVKSLTPEEADLVQRNIKAGIERLKTFAQRDGGFAYWPGGENSDSWGTTYAGHFLIEAESKGYYVSADIMKRWKKYQKDKAQNWRRNQEQYSSELIQAYRLYTLALAGSPEMGAMNRLREEQGLPLTAAWMLAAAYVKAGQPDAARSLIANLDVVVKPYREMGWSYGSDLRDRAIILETLVLLGEKEKGFSVLKDICRDLGNRSYWCSTQTIAWCLKSVSSYVAGNAQGPLRFAYTLDGKEVDAGTDLPVAQVAVAMNGIRAIPLRVVSQSQGSLFVRVISEGTPARGKEQAASDGLAVSVSYSTNDGAPVDVSRLEPGSEFVASVSVSNPGYRGVYKNLALSQIFPSGWEINNLRLEEAEERITSDAFTYQDIRDDRVYTFFDLAPGQRKTFRVLLTATYEGTYYLPALSCEAMYDNSVYARTAGQEVRVARNENQQP